MPSLNQISYNILNLMRGGRSSNDEIFSLDQIKFQIKYYRSLLLRRDAERNLERLEAFEQDLGYIDVEIINSTDLEDAFYGSIIMKSSKKLPSPVRLKNKEGITYVAQYGKSNHNIPLLDSVRSPWQRYNKYTSDNSFCYLKNDFLYIINDISLDKVYVRGVFEDPEEVFNFTKENGLDLYDENSEFPISSDMLQQITQSIINGEGNILLQSPNDNELDRDSQ